MNLLRHFRKRIAIRSYVQKLPRLLAKDYGRSKSYTPRQIRSTIERTGLNTEYSCYGVAMFSSREAFAVFHSEIGENCDFDAMRAEIAHLHFNENIEFTTTEIGNVFSDHASSAEHDSSNHNGSGGGHAGQ